MQPPGAEARRVGSLRATSAVSPPRGTVVVQLQEVSPGGGRLASLDASVPAIAITDDAGRPRGRIPLGDLVGILGMHWLASGRGLVVWTWDEVHVVGLDGEREVAFGLDSPRDPAPAFTIEDVRPFPRGLLVSAQTCGTEKTVNRHAIVVHVDGARVTGTTDLAPWSGEVLFAATPFRDGRIVLALNDHEHIEAARQQCARERWDEDVDVVWLCAYLTVPTQFFAHEFRVLRVHRPGLVEVQGQHACPLERGCRVTNWAPSADELVWTDSWQVHRLLSDPSPSPLMASGGAWSSGAVPDASRWTDVHSLWLERGTLLHATRQRVWTTALDGAGGRAWSWRDAGPIRVRPRPERWSTAMVSDFELPQRNEVFSARPTPDGKGAVVALGLRIVELDFASGRETTLFRMIDVPHAFDAANSGVYFADAKRLRSGMLAFDVAMIGEPERSIATVVSNRPHRDCPGALPNGMHGRREPSDERYRELLPWVRKRSYRW